MSTDGPIRCAHCGHVLGQRHGELVIIRYHRREIVAGQVVSIRCENCRAAWYTARQHGTD